jgi:hypothetical protein
VSPPSDAAATDGIDRWCTNQSGHDICADFDGLALTDGWGQFGSASAFEAISSSRSAPNALRVTHSADTPAGPGGGIGIVQFIEKGLPKHIRLAFDLHVEAVGLDNDGYSRDPVVIQLVDGDHVPEGVALSLRPDSTGLKAFAFATPQTTPVPGKNVSVQAVAQFPSGEWVTVVMDVERSATELRARLSYGNTNVGEITLPSTQRAITQVAVNLGSLTPAMGAEPFVAAFDNVVADVD